METQKEFKGIRGEDLTPEQRERWLNFYRMVMQRRRETKAEIQEYAKTEAYKESMNRLKERNAERGTPSV